MSDQDELRELLTRTTKTGESPTQKELHTISLRGTLAERKQHRSGLTRAFSDLARRSSRGEDLSERVEDIVARYAPTEVSDPAALAAGVSRELRPWKGERPGEGKNVDATALTRLASELSHSVISKKPISNSDLAHLQPSADMTPAQQATWRSEIRAASKRVAQLAETGHHTPAHELAKQLAGGLAEGLAELEHVDPADAARRPDGSYDVAALMAQMPRAL